MKKVTRLISLSIAIMLVLGLVIGAAGAQDEKVLHLNLGSEPPTLDPSLATDTTSVQVITELFVGLTRLHEVDVVVEPGMATDWEVSEDGLTYTFHLMDNVSWVRYDADSGEVVQVMDDEGNPRLVTAHDFVYGIRKTLDPMTAADYAYVPAEWILNGDAVNSGEMPVEDLGVRAVDDFTVEITATSPASFLPNIFGLWFMAAQPSWVVEEHGDFWTEAENIQSYGPFALAEWEHEDSLVLVKNPFWAGTDSVPAPKVDRIEFAMITEVSTAFANFEAGTLDVSGVPSADIDRVMADPELSELVFISPLGCTYYYGFNVEKEPFTDARIRRAFSIAIDRQAIIDNILKGGQEPAYFFSRQDILTAAPRAADYPDLAISSNPEDALPIFEEYLADTGQTREDLPTITLMHNESEFHSLIAQAVQQMWKETLGVDVQIQSQEWGTYLDLLDEDPPQIFRLGWCQDYPDAHNFLSDVFRSDSSNNHTNYASEEFDALVDQARLETDVDVRTELYAQAEYLLTNADAAIAPIYFYTSGVTVTAPYIERTYPVIGTNRYEKWDIVSE